MPTRIAHAEEETKGENIDDEHEIWCAIRYLDPDEKEVECNGSAIISLLALVLMICMVWVELNLRGL